MKGLLFILLFAWFLPASAADKLSIEGRDLELKAQARACYLGFIKLYDADYFRGSGQDGPTRCIRVSYLRDFSASQLDEATRETYRDLHGEAVAERHRAWLERIGMAYRAVRPGDRYLYCVDAGGAGALLRDEVTVASIPSNDFARRFLQIWVRSEDADQMPDWRFGRC
jgi:hypothetical protein